MAEDELMFGDQDPKASWIIHGDPNWCNAGTLLILFLFLRPIQLSPHVFFPW